MSPKESHQGTRVNARARVGGSFSRRCHASMAVSLFALCGCTVHVFGQHLPPACGHHERWSKEVVICVENVDEGLRSRPAGRSHRGRRVAAYQGPWRFYPFEMHGLNHHRYGTTDKEIGTNCDALLNGSWTIERKNGALLVEDIYDHGHLISSKTYDRKGRLREWLDYSIAQPEEPYRGYVQTCRWFMGKERVTDGIACVVDGQVGIYRLDFLRDRARLGK